MNCSTENKKLNAFFQLFEKNEIRKNLVKILKSDSASYAFSKKMRLENEAIYIKLKMEWIKLLQQHI